MIFAISVYFILYILLYGATEDDGTNIVYYTNQTSPFIVNRFTGMLIMGYSWTQMTLFAIVPEEVWTSMLDYMKLFIPLAAALGVWIVRNIGRSERGSLKWPLIGAFAAYPLRYYIYDESGWFMAMTITSSLLFDSFSPKNTHILSRWGNLKRCLGEIFVFPIFEKRQITVLNDVHRKQNAYKVLSLSQESSQQEITDAWRRILFDLYPHKVNDNSQRRTANQRFLAIQDALLKYHIPIPAQEGNFQGTDEDTPASEYSGQQHIPIPARERNLQRAGESTPSPECSSLHHIPFPAQEGNFQGTDEDTPASEYSGQQHIPIPARERKLQRAGESPPSPECSSLHHIPISAQEGNFQGTDEDTPSSEYSGQQHIPIPARERNLQRAGESPPSPECSSLHHIPISAQEGNFQGTDEDTPASEYSGQQHIPIPARERNLQRAGESTPSPECSSLHHIPFPARERNIQRASTPSSEFSCLDRNMNMNPDSFDVSASVRAHSVDVELNRIDREYSSSESSRSSISTDDCYMRNIKAVVANRSYITYWSGSSLDESVNTSITSKCPSGDLGRVSSSTTQYPNSTVSIRPGFLKRSFKRLRQNRLTDIVGRFLNHNIFNKKGDSDYAIICHIRPIFGLASILSISDSCIFNYEQNFNPNSSNTFLSKFRKMSCKRRETSDDSVTSDSQSQPTTTMHGRATRNQLNRYRIRNNNGRI